MQRGREEEPDGIGKTLMAEPPQDRRREPVRRADTICVGQGISPNRSARQLYGRKIGLIAPSKEEGLQSHQRLWASAGRPVPWDQTTTEEIHLS
jgi:hypothetical protein